MHADAHITDPSAVENCNGLAEWAAVLATFLIREDYPRMDTQKG